MLELDTVHAAALYAGLHRSKIQAAISKGEIAKVERHMGKGFSIVTFVYKEDIDKLMEEMADTGAFPSMVSYNLGSKGKFKPSQEDNATAAARRKIEDRMLELELKRGLEEVWS
jgi:hypothetical protein